MSIENHIDVVCYKIETVVFKTVFCISHSYGNPLAQSASNSRGSYQCSSVEKMLRLQVCCCHYI